MSSGTIKPPPLRLRKSGNVLEISLDHDPGNAQAAPAPLPLSARTLLEPLLSYRYKKFLYGLERHDPISGMMRNVIVTEKILYRYDKYGRLITNFGFRERVTEALRAAGHDCNCYIVDNPLARPDCFQVEKGNILRHFAYKQRQEEAIAAILVNWGGVIHAVTGFGKMVLLVMTVLLYPHAKIDLVIRRTTIANKIYDSLIRYIPNIGRVGGGKRDKRRITVYNAGSLHHADFDSDIVLCDEVHELLADDASSYLSHYNNARMFAFTASPKGRLDGADIRLEALFGPTIFYLPYWEAVELGLVVPIRVEWSDVVMNFNPAANKKDVQRKRWGIWRNEYRNGVIAAKARTFSDDEQVLILVDTVEHAVYLRRHLPGYTLVYAPGEIRGKDSYTAAGLIESGEGVMKLGQSEILRKEFEAGRLKKAIATDVWSTGIDPQQLTALIRANCSQTETRDIQAPGRVSRTHSSSGKDVGIVCDFSDQFDTGFADAAKKRRSHYAAMRWDQVASGTPVATLAGV